MSDFVAICYDTRFEAEEVRTKLLKMQREYLIDVEDAVVAWKNDKGKVKLNQTNDLTGAGAVSGGFWGLLIGTLFMSPLLGVAVGASAGAVSGALSDIGIDDNFMKSLADGFQPGNSALFVLVRNATPDKVLAELQGTGGRIMKTSLTSEKEERLQGVIAGTKQEELEA